MKRIDYIENVLDSNECFVDLLNSYCLNEVTDASLVPALDIIKNNNQEIRNFVEDISIALYKNFHISSWRISIINRIL